MSNKNFTIKKQDNIELKTNEFNTPLTQYEISQIIWEEMKLNSGFITKKRANEIVKKYRTNTDRLYNIIKHLDPNIYEDSETQTIRMVIK